MPVFQNVRFLGDSPPGEDPPGQSLAIRLRDDLTARGWQVSGIDDWRDGGFVFTCKLQDSSLDVIFVKTGGIREWDLSVGPTYAPGVIGRLMRRQASAPAEATLKLAMDVHDIPASQPTFSDFKWCWDGDPASSKRTTEKPAALG